MPERLTRWPMVLALAAVAASASVAACRAARPATRVTAIVVPGVAPESALFIRGTADAAGRISNDDQIEIAYRVMSTYYFPPDNQARWLDPRPLAHVRVEAADDTVGTDPDFADDVIREAQNSRICVLGGRDFGCRGKSGGIVRLSWPYRISKDTAVVFAVFRTRDSLGVAGKPEPERQFRLRYNGDGYWELRRSTLVNPAEQKRP